MHLLFFRTEKNRTEKQMSSGCCFCNLKAPCSTIFDNEPSEDGGSIRCDFKYCDCGHKFFPSTDVSIKELASHVGSSVDAFIQREAAADPTLLFSMQSCAAPPLGSFPVVYPAESRTSSASVVIILELDDKKCSISEWLPEVFRCAYAGTPAFPYIFTRRFRSRKHLLEGLLLGELHANLSSAHTADPKRLPVLLVLSSHGPSQGQIFCTTPSPYSAKFDDYREYCSLHDFVVTAQMAFGDVLCGIYVSSCYAAKLDKSHKDYPVDVSWLIDGTLKVELAGPAAEVYYSGSQTADTHIISSFVEAAALIEKEKFLCSRPLGRIVKNAQERMFPDLCDEMKLRYLNNMDLSAIFGKSVRYRINEAPYKKSGDSCENSILIKDEDDVEEEEEKKEKEKEEERVDESKSDGKGDNKNSKEQDGGEKEKEEEEEEEEDTVHEHKVITSDLVVAFLPLSSRERLLAVSLSKNLSMRSDIKVDALVVTIDNVEEKLRMYADSKRLFLIVLDAPVGHSFFSERVRSKECFEVSKRLSTANKYPYGTLYVCGSKDTVRRYTAQTPYPTAALCIESVRPSTWIPFLMYAMHLPVGENGSAAASLNASFSSDVVPPKEKWELDDVVKECNHVCSGMAHDSTLQTLSTWDPSSAPHHTPRLKPLPGGVLSNVKKEKDVSSATTSTTTSSSSSANPTTFLPLPITTTTITAGNGCDVPDLQQQQQQPPQQKRIKIAGSQERRRGRRKSGNCKYSDEDLPLSANFREAPVTHMAIQWDVDFSRQVMYGEIEYRVGGSGSGSDTATAATTNNSVCNAKELVLDCSMLTVWEVFFVQQEASSSGPPVDALVPAEYVTTPYSVTVMRPPGATQFPERVVVRFSTTPEGLSVIWRRDADANPCVFTGCCSLNNRSIMPCQDAPAAAVTYTASVTVPRDYRVLMSAPPDPSRPPQRTLAASGGEKVTYSFRMNTPLPPSTISIAVGVFEECPVYGLSVPASIYAPRSLMPAAVKAFAEPLRHLVPAFTAYLGPFPFERADIAVMPPDFLPLGLQNPNITFLSQSMVAADGSMTGHLAHELAHNYFGLLVSESDWYEMWLSEGFADYTSERVLLRCLGLAPREQEEHARVASLLRYQSLLDDLRNTDDSEHSLASAEPVEGVVKGCMRPVLGTIQYNMGYFILRHLALSVGVERFDAFLARYVEHFRNKLLTGRDALDFFFEVFPDVHTLTFCTEVMEAWLDSTNIYDNLAWKIRSLCSCSKDTNRFLAAIERALALFYRADAFIAAGRIAHAKILCKEIASEMRSVWDTTMISLFLAMADEVDQVHSRTYTILAKYLSLTKANADVRNAFCEIIVKRRITKLYPEVERLLLHDQSMGLYVFSGLLNGGSKERKLAISVYEKLNGKQDPQKQITMLKLLRDYKVIK